MVLIHTNGICRSRFVNSLLEACILGRVGVKECKITFKLISSLVYYFQHRILLKVLVKSTPPNSKSIWCILDAAVPGN
jgi:hypothetical protein